VFNVTPLVYMYPLNEEDLNSDTRCSKERYYHYEWS